MEVEYLQREPGIHGAKCVGWVESIETHHLSGGQAMGFARAQPILRGTGFDNATLIGLLMSVAAIEVRGLSIEVFQATRRARVGSFEE